MKKRIHRLHVIILLSLVTIAIILLTTNFILEKNYSNQPTTFGISYSPRYAKELGLNEKATYQSILSDLKTKVVRLNAYWDEIELQKDQFNFDELDWLVDEAAKHKAQVILAIGYKLPRWPECRAPSWLEYNDYKSYKNYNYLRERQLLMLRAVIEHFEKNPTISAWQVENEPLLKFGLCPQPDRDFLQKEVAYINSQTKKPIMVTDSGELRLWITPMKLSDIFGTTLYRKVDDPIFGEIFYPLPPWFYRLKSDLVRKFFAPNNQQTIVSELQAEVWAAKPLNEIPLQEQLNHYSLDQFKQTISFAKRTGFRQVYLWGVEWWYYLASHGHLEYLEYAKGLF